jgi:hypothetical protein
MLLNCGNRCRDILIRLAQPSLRHDHLVGARHGRHHRTQTRQHWGNAGGDTIKTPAVTRESSNRNRLLQSLARNHALVDGNKGLALAAVIAFYGVNGRRLTLTNDEAYDLVIDVATGHLDSIETINVRLRNATEPRP